MSCMTFHSHYNECLQVYVTMRLTGKGTQLYSVEVVVGGPVRGPCPVDVTPFALFVWSVNIKQMHTVKPESKGYQVMPSVTLLC